ncbi:MAG: hypothetical protein GH145_03800 [Firmicutes bacterium]|nr:hypothetical protein [Bacillota bacterium]
MQNKYSSNSFLWVVQQNATAHGQPGQIPSFLKEQGIEVIIAGGMGPRAVGFFNQLGIKAVTGATGKVKEAVGQLLRRRA